MQGIIALLAVTGLAGGDGGWTSRIAANHEGREGLGLFPGNPLLRPNVLRSLNAMESAIGKWRPCQKLAANAVKSSFQDAQHRG